MPPSHGAIFSKTASKPLLRVTITLSSTNFPSDAAVTVVTAPRSEFARESELARHNERLRSEAVSVDFPSDIRANIFKAAAQGQLEVIK
jgi:hypothetical protein